MTEIWKVVPGFEGCYEVSNQGRVRSLDRLVERKGTSRRAAGTLFVPGRQMRLSLCGGDYRRVNICANGECCFRQVSHLVAEAFLGPRPEMEEVRHLNGNSTDDRSANLAYGSPKQNSADRDEHGNTHRGERSACSVLLKEEIIAIRAAKGSARQIDLAATYGVSQAHISKIQLRKVWAHV